MHLFWTMALHLLSLRCSNKNLMILCSRTPCLMNMESSPKSGTTLGCFWDSSPTEIGEHTFYSHLHQSNPAEDDWKSLRPYCGWQSEQVIQNTYKGTGRFGGTVPQHDYIKKHFKSRNPVFNIPRRNEPVATQYSLQ